MPVTITFNKVSEVKPQNGQEIIYLKRTESLGYDGFDPRECTVWYDYVDADGTSCCESSGDADEVEQIMFDDIIADMDSLWIDLDEYWLSFSSQGP
jgi:hypothetical protein